MQDISVIDFNLYILISVAFTLILGACGVFAYFYFNQLNEPPEMASPPLVKPQKKKRSAKKAPNSRVSKKNETGGLASKVKQRVEEIELSKLTSDERENEMRVRANQLEAILSLMRANPQKFGSVSSEDLTNQLSTFYTTAAPTSFPVS